MSLPSAPNPPGAGIAAPVNVPILQRQLRRATRQLWLFTGLALLAALLVLAGAAAGNLADVGGLAILAVILAVAAGLQVPYRRRLRRAIEQAAQGRSLPRENNY